MPERDGDEQELELLLRRLSGRVILALISLIVVVAVLSPLFDRALDTALVLGLVASLIGALLTLAGFAVAFRNRNGSS